MSAPAGDRFAPLCAVALAGALADGALLALASQGRLPVAAFVLLHALLALAVAGALARRSGERAGALLVGLGLLLMGPFGALGAVLALGRERIAPPRAAALEDWHRQLSGAAERSAARTLHEDIAEGRAFRPGALPERFDAVMARGSVADRQAVLGLLVKERASPASPLLAEALRSRDVAVRASAAAAVARLRETAANGAAP